MLLAPARFRPASVAIVLLLLAAGCALGVPSLDPSRALADESADHRAPPPNVDAFVVPPGQEELLAKMLGPTTLPEQCQFTDGSINGPVVVATYTCPTGQVVFELRHPDEAPAGAQRTEKFAVAVKSGTPPAGLADAVLRSIKAHEAQFKWLSLVPPKPPSRGFLSILIPVLGVAAIIFVLRRMRRARRSG